VHTPFHSARRSSTEAFAPLPLFLRPLDPESNGCIPSLFSAFTIETLPFHSSFHRRESFIFSPPFFPSFSLFISQHSCAVKGDLSLSLNSGMQDDRCSSSNPREGRSNTIFSPRPEKEGRKALFCLGRPFLGVRRQRTARDPFPLLAFGGQGARSIFWQCPRMRQRGGGFWDSRMSDPLLLSICFFLSKFYKSPKVLPLVQLGKHFPFTFLTGREEFLTLASPMFSVPIRNIGLKSYLGDLGINQPFPVPFFFSNLLSFFLFEIRSGLSFSPYHSSPQHNLLLPPQAILIKPLDVFSPTKSGVTFLVPCLRRQQGRSIFFFPQAFPQLCEKGSPPPQKNPPPPKTPPPPPPGNLNSFSLFFPPFTFFRIRRDTLQLR